MSLNWDSLNHENLRAMDHYCYLNDYAHLAVKIVKGQHAVYKYNHCKYAILPKELEQWNTLVPNDMKNVAMDGNKSHHQVSF